VYDIELRDRIEVTNTYYGEISGTLIDQNILNTMAARGVAIQPSLRSIGIATFANAGNTNTTGLDLTGNYASDFDNYGQVDWTLGFNFNRSYFTKIGSSGRRLMFIRTVRRSGSIPRVAADHGVRPKRAAHRDT